MPITDDKEMFVIRRDYSGGQNNRVHGSNIADTQATVLTNVDISVPSQRSKRPGETLLATISGNPGLGLFGFEPDGGTNVLAAVEGTTLWTAPSTWSFTSRKADFTTSLIPTIFKIGMSGVGDVFVVGNGTDDWFLFNPANYSTPTDLGNGNTSPTLSNVGLYYRNRFWILKSNNLYWSDAFSSNYGTAFDRTSNFYRMPIGTEMALIGLRDEGILVMGKDQIWAINPSVTPAATDQPVKILEIGCVNGRTACQVGDDVYYLAADGVRGVFRSQQDKLQLGSSYPLSYVLKAEIDSINWAQISKACAVYWDNKYFISLPTNASSTNNKVLVYFPASQGWMVISGWNVAAWTTMRVSGQQLLFAMDSTTGIVYQAWTGYSDNTVAIDMVEESKKEDFGQPLIKKVGGVLKVRALSSGAYTLTVSASVDDNAYQVLGTMNLVGNSPTLPIALPFTLADSNVVEEQFHLDSLGEFYQIRIKIEHNATNGSDPITIYETNLTTYACVYQSEA